MDSFLGCQAKEGPKFRPIVNAREEGGYTIYTKSRKYRKARGWPYLPTPGGKETAAMTCVGVASLILCQSQLLKNQKVYPKDLRAKVTIAIEDGLAWLEYHFTVKENKFGDPGSSGGAPLWHYYYLYGLERVGVLSKRKFIGKHHWYFEGATLLMESQSGGAFISKNGYTFTDTCFALLFLKRATNPVKYTPVTR